MIAHSVIQQAPAAGEASAEETAGVLRRAVRAGAWSVAGYLATGIGAFAVSLIVARSLSASGFGSYSYFLWVARTAAIFFAFGVPLAIARFVSEGLGAGDTARAYGAASLAYKVAGRVAPVAFAFVAAVALLKDEGVAFAVILGTAAGVLVVNQILEGGISGHRRFDRIAMGFAVGATAQVALIALGAALGVGWRGFVALQAVAFLPVALMFRSASRSLWRGAPRRPADGDERRRFRTFAGIMGAQIAADLILWGRPEIFFIERWLSSSDVGLYSVALAIVYLSVTVPVLAARVFFPEFSFLRGGGNDALLRAAFPSICTYLTLLAVPLCIVGAALTPGIIRILYGPEFTGAATAASILMAGSIFGAIGGPASAATQTGPKPSIVLRVVAVLGAVNLALDVLLVPRFGLVGAAAASIASQGIAVSIVVGYIWTRLDLRYPIWVIARLVAAGALGAAAAFVVSRATAGAPGVIAGGVAGLTVYAAAAWVSRAVRWTELRAAIRRAPVGAPAPALEVTP